MSLAAGALIFFLGAKLALDFISASKGMGLKYDIAYVVLLLLVAVTIFFFDNDQERLEMALISLGCAVMWSVWVYIKYFTSTGQKLTKRSN